MRLKDAEGMAKSVDSENTAPLETVYSSSALFARST